MLVTLRGILNEMATVSNREGCRHTAPLPNESCVFDTVVLSFFFQDIHKLTAKQYTAATNYVVRVACHLRLAASRANQLVQVARLLREQLRRIAALDYASIAHHNNLVILGHANEIMRDYNDRLIGQVLKQRVHDRVVALYIHATSCVSGKMNA